MERISKAAAIRMLNHLVMVPKARSGDDTSLIQWRQKVCTTLGTIFGDESKPVKDFDAIKWVKIRPFHTPLSPESEKANRERLQIASAQSQALLQGLVERVYHWPDDPSPSTSPPPTPPQSESNVSQLTNRVFIVHGHDSRLRNAVARYVECLGLTPIILSEQDDRGRTVIEKFEQESRCDFAVVLATADDLAASMKALSRVEPSAVPDKLQLRARQNVVFELGYFVAMLKRERVMLITDQGIEIFSDYSGVLYTHPEQFGGKLWKELEAIGYDFGKDKIKRATSIEI